RQPGAQHADEADIQQPRRRSGDLMDGGLAGDLREPVQAAEVAAELNGQPTADRFGKVLTLARQQRQGGEGRRGAGAGHGRFSLTDVTHASGCGSMCTVWVASVPVAWTVTSPGGPRCGSACTLCPGGRRGRRWRTTRIAPAAARMTTTGSRMTSHVGT